MPATDSNMHIINATPFNLGELQTETVYERVNAGTLSSPDDATTDDQMNLVESSGVLNFWDSPDEDIYREADGDTP